MQALGVILEDELPIGRDVVVDPARRLEAREVEAAEPADQRREGARERLRLAREIEKDESLPRLERHPVQRVVAFLEPSDLAHVRRADQLAVDGVGPGVVGALDRFGETPLGLLTQPRAAVAAHVVEGTRRAVPAPDHYHAFARDRAEHIVAGLGDLGGPARADPAAREDALLLFRMDLPRRVVAAGERALPLLIRLGGFDECAHSNVRIHSRPSGCQVRARLKPRLGTAGKPA